MNSNIYNIEDRRRAAQERPLSDTVSLAMAEFKVFVETRIAMLRAEMRENMKNLKFAAPLLVTGVLFGATAWLVLTGALVAVIAMAFHDTAYAPFIALIIVGVFYAAVAACAIWMAMGRLSKQGIMPERTINVLKEDKVWLQQEAKTQL